MLINRLTDFVKGEVKMEPHQVTAALGLLKKSLPDLSAQAGGTDNEGRLIEVISKVSCLPNENADRT